MGQRKKAKYYYKVVEKLLNYREYKQRLKVIEYRLFSKRDTKKAVNYSSPSVQSSNIFDSTFEAVIDRLESDLAKEYKKKFDIVNLIDLSLAGLDEDGRFIIERKYLTGRKVSDSEIYNHFEFPHGKNKYYEIKDESVEKIAKILGYIKTGVKSE